MKSEGLGIPLLTITGSASAIDALIKHFRDSDRLSREEFLVLIRDSQTRSSL